RLLSPRVSLGNDVPDEWTFGLRIGVPLFRSLVLLSKSHLQIAVLRGDIWMGPQEVAKEQYKLLTEAAGLPDMEMRSALARLFAEVTLGAFRIVSAEDIAQTPQRDTIRSERLEGGDG